MTGSLSPVNMYVSDKRTHFYVIMAYVFAGGEKQNRGGVFTDDMASEEVLPRYFKQILIPTLIHDHSPEVISKQLPVGCQVEPEVPKKNKK